MANELQIPWYTGKNVYFYIWNTVGLVWNGVTFVTYVSADYGSDYWIDAVEQGTGGSGYYTATVVGMPAGCYYVVARERIGVNHVESDPTIGYGALQWDGNVVLPLSSVPTNTSLLTIVDELLKRDVSNVEAAAAVHSLATVILKLCSKFDAKLGQTYRTNGSTVHMTQTPTTDNTMVPIRSLGVGA